MTKKGSVDLLSDLWEDWTPEERKSLLKGAKCNTSWADCGSMREMVERGGGMTAKELHNLTKKTIKKNGGKMKVRFKSGKEKTYFFDEDLGF